MKAQKKVEDERQLGKRLEGKMDINKRAGGEEFHSIEFLDEHDLEMLEDASQDENYRIKSDDENNSAYFQTAAGTSPRYVPVFQHSPNQALDDNHSDDHLNSSLASSTSSSSILITDSQRDFAISPLMPETETSRTSSSHQRALAMAQVKCPACSESMRMYYCVKCIQKGKFMTLNEDGEFNQRDIVDEYMRSESTTMRSSEEIQTQSFNNQDNDKQILLDEMLQVKYRNLVKKIEVLKNLFQGQKLKLKQTLQFLEETKAQLEHDRKSNRSTEGKIELMKRIITSRKASIHKRYSAEATLSEDLKQYVKRRSFQLTNDVFPLEEINLFERSNSFVNMETSPLLTFSDGSHHQIEQQTAFSIVEPWLPSDGDYSPYSLWVNDNREHLAATMSDSSERNPAFRIGAALAYTTQLTQNLASYLNMVLPAPLDLAVFNRELLDDTQFSYNVAKLNSNIIHLCITQGVDISLLHPQRTLKNLMLLFNINTGDLGRKPIIELDDEEAAMKIEEKLGADLALVQDNFYDFSKFAVDDDNSDSDWEISDSINTPDMPMAIEQSIQQNSYISRLPLRLLSSFWGTGS